MAYLQAYLSVSEDMGGVQFGSSSSGLRSRLKSGDMEANIWALLPSGVLTEQVLKRLPLKSNVRLRSVCKEWYELLSSYSPPQTRGVCFFGTSAQVSDQVHYSVHDPLPSKGNSKDELNSSSTLKTMKLDFSFLPKGDVLQPCGAGGGLICFTRSRVTGRQESAFCPDDFFVCNPITKKYMQLSGENNELIFPDEVDDEFVQVIYELLVDDSNEYKFFVARVGNSLIKLHIYDSRSNSWTNEMTPEAPHPQNFMHWDLETVPVLRNGQLRVIDVLHLDSEIEGDDMTSKRILTAFTVSQSSSFRIVGAQDSLYAAEVRMSPARELGIWKEDGNGWEKVAALPPDSANVLLECFTGVQFSRDLDCQMCWFSDDLLCIKLSKAPILSILTFHLKTKSWHLWHAPFSFLPNLRPCYTMFPFTPSLEQVP